MNATLLAVIHESGRQLHRYLMRCLRNPADVDDLAQEVYKRLLATPDEATIDNPGAYLFGTARHVLADFRADENARCKCVVEHDASDDWLDQSACVLPDDMADRLSLQQQIDRALETLTPRQQFVLIAHKRDGLSYDEIAVLLGISWETVSRHLVDARMRIRAAGRER